MSEKVSVETTEWTPGKDPDDPNFYTHPIKASEICIAKDLLTELNTKGIRARLNADTQGDSKVYILNKKLDGTVDEENIKNFHTAFPNAILGLASPSTTKPRIPKKQIRKPSIS